MKLHFTPDWPPMMGGQWNRHKEYSFTVIARPITFGPFKTREEAQAAFNKLKMENPEDDKSGNQEVPLRSYEEDVPDSSGGLQTTKVDSWSASGGENGINVGEEEPIVNKDYCPTCLCLLRHEDPMQSCTCEPKWQLGEW
jgi:hypothetical protein